MKTRSISIVLMLTAIIAASWLFVSCPNEIQAPRYGSLSVSTGARAARTIAPSAVEIDVTSYRVSGVHSDGITTFEPVISATQPITVDNLKVGTWTITVDGLNSGLDVVSTQTQNVIIESGKTTSATFDLVIPEGTGTVEITVTWPDSVTSFSQVRGTITPTVTGKEGFTVATSTATTVGGESTIEQTIAAFPTGSYQFKLEFLDAGGNPVGLSYREALNVYKDMTSSKTYIVPEVIFPIETPVISMDSLYQVSISCGTGDVTIYYTTDGNEPTLASDEYLASFTITQNTTVKAIAVREDRLSSAVATVDLEVPAAAPLFDPEANTYESPQTVSLSSFTDGADIYYFLNDDPTSNPYVSPIQVNENTTIKAIATHPDYADSAESVASYLVKVAAPSVSHASNSYLGEQSVTLESATTGASIYYTLDGSDPTSGTLYEQSILIQDDTTLRAVAKKSNMENSPIVEREYVILEKKVATPTFDPVPGTFSTSQSVTISSETPGASIYYTTNGEDPATLGTLYSGPIPVTQTTTIKAIGILPDDWVDSDVATGTYTLQVVAPAISLDSDTYQADRTVQLTTTTAGATIYYTLDDSDPKTSLTRIEYKGEFSIDRSLTLRAMAEKSGWLSSTESSETYAMYVASPTFSVAADTYASAQSVEITSATSNATIYYTTNGDPPTASSTAYTGAVNVNQSMTLKALAMKDGCTDSSISSASYVIQGSSGLTVRDLANYSISIQLPEGWDTGIVVTGAGGTVTAVVSPILEEDGVIYTWYLDGVEARNRIGDIASEGMSLEFGIGGEDVFLSSGPHLLAVGISIGNISFSEQKVIVASQNGTVGTLGQLVVGDIGPSGGYIFYDDEADEVDDIPGYRYLEAAPAGWSGDSADPGYVFGYYRPEGTNIMVGGTDTTIGNGEANTAALTAAMGSTAYSSSTGTEKAVYAAKICEEYTGGGNDDWFLPSKDELNLMYQNLKVQGLGGFSAVGFYWSSSEGSEDGAWYQKFGTGSQLDNYRFIEYRVRPVRAF